MGSNMNRLHKSKMICDHNHTIDTLLYETYYSDKMVDFLKTYEVFEGNTAPSGHSDMSLKKYSVENLPKLIFELPNVKKYLLPE